MNKQKFLQFKINGSPKQFITVVENFTITIEAQIGEIIFNSKLFAQDIPSETNGKILFYGNNLPSLTNIIS